MKKAFTGFLAAALILTIGTTAFAAGPRRGRNSITKNNNSSNSVKTVCVHTDTNKDGICDNCELQIKNWANGTGCGMYYADEDGDGVCDNYGTNCGMYYADEDGDGVCDNYGTNCGMYYADEDGDGVCDNYAAGGGYGRGCGRGNGRCGGRRQ